MTAIALPNRAHVASLSPAPSWDEHLPALGGLYDVVAALAGVQTPEALTIAAGVITPSRGAGLVDTEGAAATDDLTNIHTDNLPDGWWLHLSIANSARVTVVKHAAGGSGQITLRDSLDLTLKAGMWLVLRRDGAAWVEVERHMGQSWWAGADIASAATLPIPETGDHFAITGTTATTAFSNDRKGRRITLRPTGVWPLTHGTYLVLPGAADYTCTAGEVLEAICLGGAPSTWLVIRAPGLNALLTLAQAWTKPQRPQAKHTANVSGSTTPDMANYCDFDWTATAAFTVANPTLTAAMVGQRGRFRLIQDATGGRVLTALGSYWKRIGGTGAPTLQTAANAIDRFDYEIVSTTRIEYSPATVEA